MGASRGRGGPRPSRAIVEQRSQGLVKGPGLDSVGSQTLRLKEEAMSQWNGDKSRFHRERKQNILRRKRTKELLGLVKAADHPASASKKAVSATVASEI